MRYDRAEVSDAWSAPAEMGGTRSLMLVGGWQGRCSSYLHLVILIFRVEASSGFLHDLLCFFSAVLACVANSRHSDGVLTRELPR